MTSPNNETGSVTDSRLPNLGLPGEPSRYLLDILPIGFPEPAGKVWFLPEPHKQVGEGHDEEGIEEEDPRFKRGALASQDQEGPQHHRIAHVPVRPTRHKTLGRIERKRGPSSLNVEEVDATDTQTHAVCDEPHPQPLQEAPVPFEGLMSDMS